MPEYDTAVLQRLPYGQGWPEAPSCQLFHCRCLNCAALTDGGCERSFSPVDDSALNTALNEEEGKKRSVWAFYSL